MCACSGKEAEYKIEEDDKYYLDIINTKPRGIIITLNVNVSSTMYDITKAKAVCSTTKGSCRLRLVFPNTHYVILTTPDNVRPDPILISPSYKIWSNITNKVIAGGSWWLVH